jgi:hypothetical protein
MKLVFDINNIKLLLTPDQADSLSNILQGCEHIEQKYMGRSFGNSEYMDFIRPAAMRDALKMSVMSTVDYDAMVFITKQQDAAK